MSRGRAAASRPRRSSYIPPQRTSAALVPMVCQIFLCMRVLSVRTRASRTTRVEAEPAFSSPRQTGLASAKKRKKATASAPQGVPHCLRFDSLRLQDISPWRHRPPDRGVSRCLARDTRPAPTSWCACPQVRMSPEKLSLFWPIMVAEIIRVCVAHVLAATQNRTHTQRSLVLDPLPNVPFVLLVQMPLRREPSSSLGVAQRTASSHVRCSWRVAVEPRGRAQLCLAVLPLSVALLLAQVQRRGAVAGAAGDAQRPQAYGPAAAAAARRVSTPA